MAHFCKYFYISLKEKNNAVFWRWDAIFLFLFEQVEKLLNLNYLKFWTKVLILNIETFIFASIFSSPEYISKRDLNK